MQNKKIIPPTPIFHEISNKMSVTEDSGKNINVYFTMSFYKTGTSIHKSQFKFTKITQNEQCSVLLVEQKNAKFPHEDSYQIYLGGKLVHENFCSPMYKAMMDFMFAMDEMGHLPDEGMSDNLSELSEQYNRI
jgi:hypothetical protein